MASTQLSASISYADSSTADVTDLSSWSSDNEAAATVDSAGLVTAVAAGSAEVTASYEGLSDTSSITVTDPA